MSAADSYQKRSLAITLAFCVLSSAAMLWLHVRLDKVIKPELVDNSKSTLPSVQSVELCSLGYNRFLADMFWLAFIQYLGELRPRGTGFVSSYDYVNLITALDPYFVKAYWFGCWAIGYWQRRPDLADKVIQRGIQYNPTDYYLPYIGGVNQQIFAQDYKRAGKYYSQASKLPGAPEYLAQYAKIMSSPMPAIAKRFQTLGMLYYRTKDEDLRASVRPQLVETLHQMYREAVTPEQRTTAVQQLEKLGEEVPK